MLRFHDICPRMHENHPIYLTTARKAAYGWIGRNLG